uniref:Major facilitator superfamily (MFS) profile domain-containing protein n=1 Tax=Globisporangium ultimum (strain ATCC 200006 / CBS 805.95 / DAOM BR144) TaxID=431595 RepID=K3WX88_GLOUD
MLLAGCCRTFAFMGAWGSLYAYTPELYPISMRVMGTSYAWGLSRIGSFGGPYTVIWMADHWHMSIAAVIWTFTGITFVVAAILVVFGVETAHQDSDRGDYKPSTSRSQEHTVDAIGYTKHEDAARPPPSQPVFFV